MRDYYSTIMISKLFRNEVRIVSRRCRHVFAAFLPPQGRNLHKEMNKSLAMMLVASIVRI